MKFFLGENQKILFTIGKIRKYDEKGVFFEEEAFSSF